MVFDLEITRLAILIVAGFLGGIVNAIAGGATFITFPALLFIGLPPTIASATNLVALFPANAAALPPVWNELRRFGARKLISLVSVALFGAFIGAFLLTISGDRVFFAIVPWLILSASVLFTFSKRINQAITKSQTDSHLAPPLLSLIAIALFSVYGGYFGAGLGIILLAVVQIMGYNDFPTANGLKNLLASSATLAGIAVLGVSGFILWPEALIMMAMSTIGGYIGGVLSKTINANYIKTFVSCFGFALGFYYLFASWNA